MCPATHAATVNFLTPGVEGQLSTRHNHIDPQKYVLTCFVCRCLSLACTDSCQNNGFFFYKGTRTFSQPVLSARGEQEGFRIV